MRRFATGGLLALLSLVVASRAAYGVPMLMLSANGSSATVADGGAVVCVGICSGTTDVNGVTGAITYIGTIGPNWVVNVTTGITKPVLGSATDPHMDLNSVDVSSAGSTLTIKFTDDGFGPLPAGTFFRDQIGGTTAGTLKATELYDPDNGAFSGGLIASLGPFGPGAFSGTTDSPVVAGVAPFSLTQVVVITHTGAGATSFDYEKTAMTPEPSALLLLGSGLAGFSYLRLRRRSGK